MLTPRRIQIFKAIVDEFIQTAEPVGSKTLMAKYNLPYSSATIRNEMLALEEMGYLEKTHTSSGRIPSTQGYKFYCEHLLDMNMDQKSQFMLQQVFDDQSLDFEDAIKKSCEILSQMTNLTTGALGPNAAEQKLEHIRLFPINSKSAVAVFITDKGHTESKTFTFVDDVTLDDIQNCCEILNDRLKGTFISEVIDKLQSIKPIIAASVKRHEILFQAFVNAFVKFASENIYFSGKNNMLYQPEFSDIEKLKNLMRLIDDKTIWRNMAKNKELTMQVNQNSEFIWLDDVAVVSRSYTINDETGKLMVVGPSRMDYDKIAAMLEYVSNMIENMYDKGGHHE